MSFERVLITGGAGLVGSHLVDGLIDAGASEIVVLDDFSRGRRENLARAASSGRLRIVEGDIRDPGDVARAMAGAGIVFHEAGIRITQCAEDPRLAKEIMVDGTFNVLEAAVREGVGRVVAASTASVYGAAEVFPITEEHHPYGNRTIYGAAKLFNEGLLRSFHDMYGLDYVALRYFNVYGPRMDTLGAYTEVLVRWMVAIESGSPPIIFGDGSETMDFVHVQDVARATLLAATAPVTDVVFNVATGVETSLHALADTLLSIMGSPLRPEYAPRRKVNPVPRRVADIAAARDGLGFRADISLADGLRSLVNWWREQRATAGR